jgi:spermidine synthase
MNRRTELVVYLAFFLSGVAGLVYQVVWSRYLGLLLGGSGAATIIVLATFMGGLGLGAWLLGKQADKAKSRIRLYAIMEMGIGVWGASYPYLFDALERFFAAAASGLEPGSARLLALKGAIAIASILPPTLLMGGTLPVLGRFLIDNLRVVGDKVARLYFINSLGAVAGSLIAGFYLIQAQGLAISMTIAAALNLLVAVVVLPLRRAERAAAKETPAPSAKAKKGKKKTEAPAAKPASPADAEVYPASAARAALWVIAISGAASMVYEVAWIRALALAFGSSVHTFALVVAAFIFGISLGSFLLRFKKSDRGWLELLGWCEIGAGAAMLFSIPMIMATPYWMNQIDGMLQRSRETFAIREAIKFAISFGAMIVPTLFIGMTLPAASKVVAREMSTLGRRVGGAFAVNTFGAIVGAIAGGTLLMPKLGVLGAIAAGVAINIALGVVALAAVPTGMKRSRWLPPVAIGALALGLFCTWSTWSVRVLAQPVFRHRDTFANWDAYWDEIHRGEILYLRDGLDASVAVVEWAEGSRSLFINGKPDAGTGPLDNPMGSLDMPNQLLCAHLPMTLLRAEPKEILVVGQGSGVTAGAAASYEGARVDLVELSPEVAETASFFAHANRDMANAPNLRLIVEDARTLLATSDKTYDLIITEPSNPWVAGNASLFTDEFYKRCADRLAPGGALLQWIHFYEMSDESMLLAVRSLRRTFPYVALWESAFGDSLFLCWREPFEPDFDEFRRRLALPNVREDLGPLGLDIPEAFLEMQLLDASATGADIAGPGPINSEFHPLLEYIAPLGFHLRNRAEIIAAFDGRDDLARRPALWSAKYQRPRGAAAPSSDRWKAAVDAVERRKTLSPGLRRRLIGQWLADHPADPDARLRLAAPSNPQERAGALRNFAGESFAPRLNEYDYRDRWLRLLEGGWDDHARSLDIPALASAEALSWLERWPAESADGKEMDGWRVERARAMLYSRLEAWSEAAEAYRRALRAGDDPRRGYLQRDQREMLASAAEAWLAAGEPGRAAEYLAAYEARAGADNRARVIAGRIDAARR